MTRLDRPANAYVFALSAVVSVAWSATAHAWGPAMHVREAERTLQILQEVDDSWQQLVDSDPLARQYLRLGAISPDFQHGSTALDFGHSKALSYHLLDAAPDDRADLKLFALGHLIHLAGDATAEVFVSPWVWAAHPLGLYDLFVGGDGRAGESETIMEGFSEITLGTWDPVIDVLYDFYLEGEDARARMDDILGWYCEQGRAFTDGDNDCDQVRIEILDKLATADDLLGALPRDEAKAYFADLLNKPPDELLWLFTGGLLQSLIGSTLDGSEHQPWEVRRFAEDFGDEQWWGFYEESFEDMAGSFSRDHLQTRNSAWPEWNAGGLAGGNHQSVMLMAPDSYAYGKGLIVDQLRWTDDAGADVDAVPADAATGRYAAELRFFSALPVAGTVRAVVRKDRPGFAATADEVLGEATLQIDIDPLAYTTVERSILTVPFDADPEQAVGFYVELTLDDEARPWFTSSWDQLWGIEEAPLFWRMYRDNFGTYHRFPGSLPLAAPAVETGALLVAVRYDVADLAIPDAQVSVDGGDPVQVGGNGVAAFDQLPPGSRNITVTFAGLDETAHATAEVTAGGQTWADLTLGATPRVSAPAWATDSCVPLTWDPVLVGRPLATALWARLAGEEEWTELPVVDEPTLCDRSETGVADGAKAQVELRIEFGADRSPEVAKSDEVAFDSSPPELPAPVVSVTCDGVTVDISPSEPHSGIAELGWTVGATDDGAWTALDAAQTSFSFDPSPTAERLLTVRAVNGAGLQTIVEAPVPPAQACADSELGDGGGDEPPQPSAEEFLGGGEAPTATGPGCAVGTGLSEGFVERWGLLRR